MDIDVERTTRTTRTTRPETDTKLSYDGKLAVLSYVKTTGRIILEHTEGPQPMEGQGIAGRLAHHALGDARSEGLRVVPTCPYVRAYLTKHPEYVDLVEDRTGTWR